MDSSKHITQTCVPDTMRFGARVSIGCTFLGEGYEDEPLMYTRAVKAKLKVTEVPCRYNSRLVGESKSPALRQAWKSLKTIFREWLVQDNFELLDRFQRQFLPFETIVVRVLRYLP